MVLIHVGLQDLWNGRTADDAMNYFKQIIWRVLEETKTQLCLSLVIPAVQYVRLNEKINTVNKCLTSLISEIRYQSKYRNRLFTANNNSLSDHLEKTVSDKGTCLTLSERGEKKLWMKLRDNIYRVTQSQNNVSSKNERIEYRYRNSSNNE